MKTSRWAWLGLAVVLTVSTSIQALEKAQITQTAAIQIFDTSPLPGGPYYVNDHSLIQAPDGSWHLFGIFHHEPFASGEEVDFVHAVAREPRPELWTGRSFVMAPGSEGIALRADPGIGETHIWAPHVVRVPDGTAHVPNAARTGSAQSEEMGAPYAMIYHGGMTDNDHASIRLAVSEDLYHWKKIGKQPLFEDICVARDPMLLRQPDQWIVYYTRCDSTDSRHSGVAYRTSRDLMHWSAPAMALVLDQTEPMFNSGFSESPYVFEKDGWYYLSITSYPMGWTATMLYRSRNPYFFEPTPIARLDAHAGEWIVEPGPGGRTWLSHCGAGQSGVWLSEVFGIEFQ